MNNNLMKMPEPQRGLVAAVAFVLPFLSLVTLWGVSFSSFLFLLVALFYFKQSRAALARHWPAVRTVGFGFLMYFLFCSFLPRAGPRCGRRRHRKARPHAARSVGAGGRCRIPPVPQRVVVGCDRRRAGWRPAGRIPAPGARDGPRSWLRPWSFSRAACARRAVKA